MSVPGQSSGLPAGARPAGVAASHRLRTEPCTSEATTGVMRGQGKYQAVMQMNVSSPEIFNITETGRVTAREADLLHCQGRPQSRGRDGETKGTLSGSEVTAWYEGKPGNPGRAERIPS